jgi:hypothetical protein
MTYNPNMPDWLHNEHDCQEVGPATNEPAGYRFVDVLPGETLGDLAKRVYGNNNVLNRLKLDLANNGQITGTIRVPK